MLLAASEITREVDRAFVLIGGVSIALLVGITIAVIVLASRFRRSRSRTTKQVEGNTKLEIVWTVVPTIIVMWMFYVGYRGFGLMGQVPDDHMVVEVVGKQWNWTFNYPDHQVSSQEMFVPVNKAVFVKLTAPVDDVIHSFYLPDFRVKEDALPGQWTSLWFMAEREGRYDVLCAEFCGKDHALMTATLRVVSPTKFNEWIRDRKLARFRPLELEAVMNPQHPAFGADDLAIDAARIFGSHCASCHAANGDGSGLPGEARNLTLLTGWKRSATVTDIYRTLTEGIEGSRMRAYPNLTPWERVAIAHYVRAFSTQPLPPDEEADYLALLEEYGLDKVQAPTDTIPIERAMELLVQEAGNPQPDASVP